ncbi:MAG TPA: class I SAM-dependent methyltransferase [Candidatus Tumulicola sp.]|nr:class I SAM-dependent methyltransferase [Candidatus Tumulicola sp.]
MQHATHDLEALLRPPHPLLLEIERRARADGVAIPSRQTGRLLSTLVACMQASRILEIGTGYGYATLWMAFAQPRMGKIWTVDADSARTDVALGYFKHAGEDDYIEIFNTPAAELLENFPHRNLDVVFIDAAAATRTAYVDLVLPMLKLSGLIVVNDVLEGEGAQAAARAFLNHAGLDSTVVPVGRGTAIGARTQ